MLRPLLQVRMKEEDATTSQGNRKDRQIEMLQGKERETEREREGEDCRAFEGFSVQAQKKRVNSMLESVERDQRQGSSGIRTSEYGSASSISIGMAEAVGTVLMVGRRWCWMAWECLGLRGWFGRPRWPGWLKGTNGTVDMAGTGMAGMVGPVRKCQVHMQ